MFFKSFVLAVFIFASVQARAALSAREIMEKNESARRYNDVVATAKLTTGGGGKSERVKDFTWWKKLSKDGVHFKTLTRFHAPVEVKNEGVLFLEGTGDKTEVLLYLPSYKKVRRVENAQQSGSFMGSEFSYADIATPHLDDYNYKLLREDKCPDYAGKDLKCYVVEYKPANDAVADRTGASKGTLWIRQDNFMDVRAEIMDSQGQSWKIMESKDIREIDPVNKKWLAFYLRMDNLKNGRYTTFTVNDVKVNKGLSDSLFTQQNLSREE